MCRHEPRVDSFFVVMRVIEDSSLLLRTSQPEQVLNVIESSHWWPFKSLSSQLLISITCLNFAVRLCLIWAAGFIAVMVPNFHVVVALIGAFTTMIISFILPPFLYICVCFKVGDNFQKHNLLLYSLLICMGFVGMFIGVQNTFEG